jgi:hypothetical protein
VLFQPSSGKPRYFKYRRTDVQILFLVGMPDSWKKKKRVCVYLRGDSKKGTCLTSMVNRLYKFRNCHGKTSTGSSTYIHTYHQGIDSTTKVLSQFLPRYLFLTAKGLRRSGNTRPHHIPNSERSLGNDKGKRPIDKPRGYICPGRTLHG